MQYGYSAMPGGANHSRLTSLTCPNGEVLSYNYASGLDASISRLSSMSDSGGTVEDYAYLGLGTVVERGHPTVDLTSIGTTPGDAGDIYTGLDRFGRVVDQRWTNGTSDLDRYQYTYDRNGNRLSRENLVSRAQSPAVHLDEVYSYDGLNQIASFARGQLNSSKSAIIGTPQASQSWNYDGLGNWQSFTDNGVSETRTHNAQNELTAAGSNTLTYDANGNMTTDETGKQFVYDAWNRLSQVKDAAGNTLASYSYDALTRRITETEGSTTRTLLYSSQWQVLEERVGGQADTQYVWSPVYIEAMVLRDRDRDTDGNGTLDERLWPTHDANFNVTGLVNASGTVVERFTYTPFGVATVHDDEYAVDANGSDWVWAYRHQGGRWSVNSRAVHFRFRDLNMSFGRWTSLEPIP